MSKVTMPEPTAEIRIVGNVSIFDLTPVGKQRGLSVGQKFITTTQAEAYADARVREALEQAEAKLMEMHEHAVKSRVPPDEDEDGWNTSCADRAIALGEAGLTIRALIPQLSGPVEPTT